MPDENNSNEDKDDILFKDIDWSKELSKYQDEINQFLQKILQDKEAKIAPMTMSEKIRWAIASVCNAHINYCVTLKNILGTLDLQSAPQMLIMGMASNLFASTVIELLLKERVLKEKKEKRDSEIEELERLL